MNGNIINSYNLYEGGHYSTIIYHAIACDENHVRDIAQEVGINIENITIDLEKENVKNELGRPLSESIEDGQVR